MIQKILTLFGFKKPNPPFPVYNPFSSSTKKLIKQQAAYLQHKSATTRPTPATPRRPLPVSINYPARPTPQLHTAQSPRGRFFDFDRMDKIADWVSNYFKVKQKAIKLGTQHFPSDSTFMGFSGDSLLPTKSPYAVLFPINIKQEDITRRRKKLIAAKAKEGKAVGTVKLKESATCMIVTLPDNTVAILAPYRHLVGHRKTAGINPPTSLRSGRSR